MRLEARMKHGVFLVKKVVTNSGICLLHSSLREQKERNQRIYLSSWHDDTNIN